MAVRGDMDRVTGIAMTVAGSERAYHSLCLALIRMILSNDKYGITYIDPARFEDNAFGLTLREMNCIRPVEAPEGADFVAQKNNRKLLFYFDDQRPGRLKDMASVIKDTDKGEFNAICVMIVRDMAGMNDRRRSSKADEWPRGFFLCFEEIQRKAEKLNAKEYSRICARAPLPEAPKRTPILSVTAEIKENIPVGEDRSHYKLRFETARSFNILSGQFIMVDTTLKGKIRKESLTWDALKKDPSRMKPKPYLKRPFGIHRAFYKHFERDYLQKVSLPPQLATVMHTVFPDSFEIFYKVLPDGLGTRELSRLEKGSKIQILGPLGKGQNIRNIRDEGFDEIHVIGGGVGMAPLIFIVQALRYYSYRVKAFIGIEKMGMLKYKRVSDGLDRTFTEEDPTLYIDDLIETGMRGADIYVSSCEQGIIHKKIPGGNVFEGLVSDQYRKYLRGATSGRKKVLAFACGPMGMMKTLAPIAEQHGIPLKVLMEKRMACGIGVCLSCVCETKKAGESESGYSRVCTEGPIFDANEIVWA